MENLKQIIPRLKDKKVLVFGDLMLDEHIWSKVARISPEAPVPVADVTKIDHVPGGCGNVAVNISALGGIPYLVGIIGKDSSGEKLRTALKKSNVSDQHIILDNKRPTILKSRIIAGSQHVVRVDREDRSEVPHTLKQRLLKKIEKLLAQVDAIVISDYGKGSVTRETAQYIISLANKRDKFVAIDPKGNNYAKYNEASIITPNLNEAQLASGIKIENEKNIAEAGKYLLKTTKSKNILITRGRDGMSLFHGKNTIHIPAIPREVFDITGAGDTVIATLSLAIAAGAKIGTAATLANTAASVVVGKIGTAPCFLDELEEAIEGHEPITKKIKLLNEVKVLIQNFKNEGAKIVFTNGCFDILHLGHVRYLKKAKKMGDILVVGLNSDASVRSLKGNKRPYVSEMERAEILASLECVDYVIIFSQLRPDDLIKAIKPHFHVKGGDYEISTLPEKKLVENLGGKVVVIPPVEGRSTTNIVERILSSK